MAEVTARAPKQWSLTREETITSFESWRQNLKYGLSLDRNFAAFIQEGVEWEKKSRNNPNRGFGDDGEEVAVAQRRTAAQKVIHFELMLGQIANYCPVISRNTIVKNSTSLENVWQSIRAHFGFQTTGAHFIDFAEMKLKPGERPEDLYQRLVAFVEDNLLTTEGGITHHDEEPDEDEEMSPMVENMVVLTWLRLVHQDLPGLVKQRYGTELRNSTLASIKPEISQAMSSLLETLQSSEEARVMRYAPTYGGPQQKSQSNFQSRKNNNHTHTQNNNRGNRQAGIGVNNKQCVLCETAGRQSSHYLSQCTFLPAADKKFLSKARLLSIIDSQDDYESADELSEDINYNNDNQSVSTRHVSLNRRVQVCKSPTLSMRFKSWNLPVLMDSGGETNMIQEAVARQIGVTISPTKQGATQADGVSPLSIRGETSFTISFGNREFQFSGLVVEHLDVGILAGVPFMKTNDITLRPAKSLIIFNDGFQYKYDENSQIGSSYSVRRVTSHIVRAPPSNTTLYPGDHIEVDVPEDLRDQTEVALEPRLNNSPLPPMWPRPVLATPLCGRIRITNDTDSPLFLRKNEQFGQLHALSTVEIPEPVHVYNSTSTVRNTIMENSLTSSNLRRKVLPTIADIVVDPNKLLTPDTVAQFNDINSHFKDVFHTKGKLYNGKYGRLEAVVNMGPSLPPQRKGRVPQYSRDKLVELQDQFDEMEEDGVVVNPDEVGITAEYLNPSFLTK